MFRRLMQLAGLALAPFATPSNRVAHSCRMSCGRREGAYYRMCLRVWQHEPVQGLVLVC